MMLRMLFFSFLIFLGLPQTGHAIAINCDQPQSDPVAAGICADARRWTGGGTTQSGVGGCPNPGERPATAADAVVQNGTIPVGTCYSPTATGISQNAEESKKYLKTLASGSVDIDRINDSFAKCAAQFFKAYTAQNGGVQIVSAYRSQDYERQLCRNNPRCGALMNNPNPVSNHSRGFAMDVYASNRSDQPKLWNFATKNPQFGVCFPFQNGDLTSFIDHPHIILAGIGGSEGGLCSKRGVSSACNGGAIDPNTVQNPNTTTTGNNPPFDQQIRQALGMQQPPPPPPPPQPPQMPQMQQPIPQPYPQTGTPSTSQPPLGTINTTPQPTGTCQMQTFCAQDGNIYYRSSQCVDQVYQRCPSGCSGATCTGTSTSATTPAISTGLADILAGGAEIGQPYIPTTSATGSPAFSAYDLIQMYANASNTPANISTTTTADLSDALAELSSSTGVLLAIVPASTSTDSSKGSTVVIVNLPPQAALQTTFSPQQLPELNGVTNNPGSTLARIEAALKDFLSQFEPFGGRVIR